MQLTVQIARMGQAGDGIADHNGQTLFVPGTLPGEQVSGTLNGDHLADIRILSPVAERVKPQCRHAKLCGGCVVQHATEPFVAHWKEQLVADQLARVGLTPEFKPIETSPMQSRRRAILTGRKTKSGAMLGFHAKRSDMLIDLTDCAVCDPRITDAFDALRALTRMTATRKQEVRLTVTTSNAGLDVHLEPPGPLSRDIQSQVIEIARTAGFARISVDGEPLVTFTPPTQTMGGAQVVTPPAAFLQATPHGQEVLTSAVLDAVLPTKRVADLFCGCGTFALPLVDHCAVDAFESDPAMVEAMTAGWRGMSGAKPLTGTARDLFRRPLEPDELAQFDAVVMDPPRAGARAQATAIANSRLSRLCYVSCNPTSFARDARILCDGGFSLGPVQVVDQFRWSAHCELVATFDRR